MGSRWPSVLLFGLALVCGCGATPREEPSPDAGGPASYVLTSRSAMGVGPFLEHLPCNNYGDTLVDGTCSYENGGPVEGSETSGEDAYGWFCGGDSPQASPYGSVVIRVVCEPAPAKPPRHTP